MVRAARRVLGGPMKTDRSQATTERATQQNIHPSPEAVRWKIAVPPRLGRGGTAGLVGEWRPSESAKRGYERAVEDWWWL